ncbi:MAG: protein-disulfide reductase DsbD family protein [Ferruginibacter sp.]
MKKLAFLLMLFFAAVTTQAQMLAPVKWTFSSKKIDAKNYEVHIVANIQQGWHLYSQTQPADAVSIPTAISFSANPMITLDGKVKEIGKMELFRDKKLNISANQYSGQVEFVQKIKLKTPVKTNMSGTVEFQTCDDKKCLPPQKVPFTVAIK